MVYIITGKVVRGDGYGRKLGFPTVNLEKPSVELPPAGVYKGKAILGKKMYRAGILINPNNKVEAHLIGFKGDLYDENITLKIFDFLRNYRKFKTENELIAQIKEDLKKC